MDRGMIMREENNEPSISVSHTKPKGPPIPLDIGKPLHMDRVEKYPMIVISK